MVKKTIEKYTLTVKKNACVQSIKVFTEKLLNGEKKLLNQTMRVQL